MLCRLGLIATLPSEPAAIGPAPPEPPRDRWLAWREAWWVHGRRQDPAVISLTLQSWNLPEAPIRPVIERIWRSWIRAMTGSRCTSGWLASA